MGHEEAAQEVPWEGPAASDAPSFDGEAATMVVIPGAVVPFAGVAHARVVLVVQVDVDIHLLGQPPCLPAAPVPPTDLRPSERMTTAMSMTGGLGEGVPRVLRRAGASATIAAGVDEQGVELRSLVVPQGLQRRREVGMVHLGPHRVLQ